MQSNLAPSSEVASQSHVDFTKDPSPPPERGTKRTAEDDPLSESHKKAKIGIIIFAAWCAKENTNFTSRTERSSS